MGIANASIATQHNTVWDGESKYDRQPVELDHGTGKGND